MACSRCCQWLSGRSAASVNEDMGHPMLPNLRADNGPRGNVELADTEGIAVTETSFSSSANPLDIKRAKQTEAQTSETHTPLEPCKTMPTKMAAADDVGTFTSDATVSTVHPAAESFKLPDSELTSWNKSPEKAKMEQPPNDDIAVAVMESRHECPERLPDGHTAAVATEVPQDLPIIEKAAPSDNCQVPPINTATHQTDNLSGDDLDESSGGLEYGIETFQSFVDDVLPEDQVHATITTHATETRTNETPPATEALQNPSQVPSGTLAEQEIKHLGETNGQPEAEEPTSGFSPRSMNSDKSKNLTVMSFASAMSDDGNTPRTIN